MGKESSIAEAGIKHNTPPPFTIKLSVTEDGLTTETGLTIKNCTWTCQIIYPTLLKQKKKNKNKKDTTHQNITVVQIYDFNWRHLGLFSYNFPFIFSLF